jgi:hypothetical protein
MPAISRDFPTASRNSARSLGDITNPEGKVMHISKSAESVPKVFAEYCVNPK